MSDAQKLTSRFLDLSGDRGLGTLAFAEGEARLVARYFPGGKPTDVPIDEARRRPLPGRIVIRITHDSSLPEEVDVTWAVLAMKASEVSELADGTAAADRLAERFHTGDGIPAAEIEKAVTAYLGVSSLADVTEDRMEQARTVLREIGPWSEFYGERLPSVIGTVLIEGGTEICSTVQDNDSETWFVTKAGQFVRVTGSDQDRFYVVEPEEAKETLLGWIDDRTARMLFGDEAAKALFDEEMRRPL